MRASSTVWPPAYVSSSVSARTSSGPSGLAGLLSRGAMWRYRSGESKCLPMELPYFLRMRSRRSSTKASALMEMRVAEPPGRFTHTLRYSGCAPASGVSPAPLPWETWSRALRRLACGSAGGAEAADMEEVGVAMVRTTVGVSLRKSGSAGPFS